MPNNSTKILLLTTFVGGVLVSVSSNSWWGAWIGLEINLISFIPLMSNVKNMYNKEASLKYFIVQVLASVTLLFIGVIKMLMEELFTFQAFYATIDVYRCIDKKIKTEIKWKGEESKFCKCCSFANMLLLAYPCLLACDNWWTSKFHKRDVLELTIICQHSSVLNNSNR